MDHEVSQEVREKIVDPIAFDKYMSLMNNALLVKYRNEAHTCSDGTPINMATPKHIIKEKIEHLEDSEIEKILKIKSVYDGIHCKAIGYKSLAFGGVHRSVSAERKNLSNLVEFRKEEIIELFGRMFSESEVHKILVEEWKIPVSVNTIRMFYKRYNELIQQKREEYKRTYSNVRLAVKRSRLDELTWMYISHKDKYKRNKNANDLKVLISLLEQIRKEVEGESIRIDGNLDVKIESTVNIHLQKEVFKEISLNQIILSRVASRTGTNSFRLLKSLVDSCYSKFTGLLSAPETEEGEVVEYPSFENYDWVEIERKQGEIKEQEAVILETRLNNDKKLAESAVKDDLKAKLLARLKANKEVLNIKESNIDKVMNKFEGGIDNETE